MSGQSARPRDNSLYCRKRLANGNTIICPRGGDHHGPQLVEITPDKKVVWVLQDWQDFGRATAVQVRDEPGIPEHTGDSLH